MRTCEARTHQGNVLSLQGGPSVFVYFLAHLSNGLEVEIPVPFQINERSKTRTGVNEDLINIKPLGNIVNSRFWFNSGSSECIG